VRGERVELIRADQRDAWSTGHLCPKGTTLGHLHHGTRVSVAVEHPGVNTNVLSPGDLVDVPSGNAAVNGIPVTIAPA